MNLQYFCEVNHVNVLVDVSGIWLLILHISLLKHGL